MTLSTHQAFALAWDSLVQDASVHTWTWLLIDQATARCISVYDVQGSYRKNEFIGASSVQLFTYVHTCKHLAGNMYRVAKKSRTFDFAAIEKGTDTLRTVLRPIKTIS